MKKQKRFTKEFEIQAEIIKYKRKLRDHLVEAEKDEDKEKEHLRLSRQSKTANEICFYIDNSVQFEIKAKKHRRSAYLIETVTLPKLKNALAAFKTQTMPFMGDDHSVVLEGL